MKNRIQFFATFFLAWVILHTNSGIPSGESEQKRKADIREVCKESTSLQPTNGRTTVYKCCKQNISTLPIVPQRCLVDGNYGVTGRHLHFDVEEDNLVNDRCEKYNVNHPQTTTKGCHDISLFVQFEHGTDNSINRHRFEFYSEDCPKEADEFDVGDSASDTASTNNLENTTVLILSDTQCIATWAEAMKRLQEQPTNFMWFADGRNYTFSVAKNSGSNTCFFNTGKFNITIKQIAIDRYITPNSPHEECPPMPDSSSTTAATAITPVTSSMCMTRRHSPTSTGSRHPHVTTANLYRRTISVNNMDTAANLYRRTISVNNMDTAEPDPPEETSPSHLVVTPKTELPVVPINTSTTETVTPKSIPDDGSIQVFEEWENFFQRISREEECTQGNDAISYGVLFLNDTTGTTDNPLKTLSNASAINYLVRSDNREIALVFANLLIQGRRTKDSSKDSRGFITAKFLLSYVPSIVISVYDRETGNTTRVNVSYSVRIDNNAAVTAERISEIRQSTKFFQSRYVNDVKYACEFYESSTQSFSDEGCRTFVINETSVMCDCNHTTIFAVLLAVEYHEISNEVKYLSIVTECISLLALLVTLIILIALRKTLMSERTLIQINLALALLLLHLSSLFTDVAIDNHRACEMLAVFVHFFLLSSVTWMSLEGFHLFMKTTDRALSFGKRNSKTVARISLATGWGIPFLIVAISAAVGFSTNASYLRTFNAQNETYVRCWLNDKNMMLLGSAIIPFAVIYCFNVIIIIKVTHFVYKMNSQAERFKPIHQRKNVEAARIGNLVHVKATLKSVIVLFPVLGIPWLFSFFAGLDDIKARTAFQFLNAIFNGLQGLFLFLVYCIVGSEVRKILFRKITTQFNSLTWTSESKAKNFSTGNSMEMSEKLH